MQLTSNLSLKKPEGTDSVNIDDFNGNADILDTEVAKLATTSDAGRMSAEDKVKLDGIAADANNYTHPDHTGDVTSTGDGVTAIAPGVIVNADVNASAAIAWSKISKTGSSLADLATRSAADLSSGTLPGARMPAISGDITISAGSTTAAITSGAIVNADINAAAAIDASKIANGSVSNAEFQYLDGVTSAIQTQLDTKAPLNSPALTGTPQATTASVDTNSTRIATTAFVVGQAGSTTPAFNSPNGTVGTSLRYARADHAHPAIYADNYKAAADVPSGYPLGSSIFFNNSAASWPSTYGTVHTIKAYVNMACVQFYYPYNSDAPMKYRYALYNSDTWLSWRDVLDSSDVDNSTLEWTSSTLRVKDGGATDAKVGNRTVTDTGTPSGDTGTLTQLFSWLGNMIKAITGKSSWRTAPSKTLEDLHGHIGAGGSVHANAVASGAAGFMTGADKAKLDGIASGANNYTHPNHTGDVTSTGDGVTAIAPGVIVNADIHTSAAIDASKIADGSVSNTEYQYINGVTSAIQTQINGKQAADATLTSLAAYNTNGLLTQTAADTFAGRTIAGTTNRIAVTNGNGVSGNPTLDIGSDVVTLTGTQTLTNKTLTNPVVSGVVTVPAGSDAAPAITASGDANTGVYFPASDTVALVTTGVERTRLDSNGDMGVGAAAGGYRLRVVKNNPTRGIIANVYNNASSSQTGAQQIFMQENIGTWAIGQPAAANAFAFWAGRSGSADGTEVARFNSSGILSVPAGIKINDVDVVTVSGTQTLTNKSISASQIDSGTIATARLPSASTSASGIAQLNNTTSSTSTTQAATANAVKSVSDTLTAHMSDSSDAHDASAISIADSGGNFTATDVEGALSELFQSVSDGKDDVAAAITDMGQTASGSDTFAELAAAIRDISDDADAAVGNVLTGKTFYQGGEKKTGTMTDRSGDTAALSSAVSGTTLKLRASEGYRDGTNDFVTITDADFIASNIKNGVNLFGLVGSMSLNYVAGSLFSEQNTATQTANFGSKLYDKADEVSGYNLIVNPNTGELAGFDYTTSTTLKKYDMNGNVVWSRTGVDRAKVAYDGDILCFNGTTLTKINWNNEVIYTRTNEILGWNDVLEDHQGNYIVTNSSLKVVRKYNTSFNQIWSTAVPDLYSTFATFTGGCDYEGSFVIYYRNGNATSHTQYYDVYSTSGTLTARKTFVPIYDLIYFDRVATTILDPDSGRWWIFYGHSTYNSTPVIVYDKTGSEIKSFSSSQGSVIGSFPKITKGYVVRGSGTVCDVYKLSDNTFIHRVNRPDGSWNGMYACALDEIGDITAVHSNYDLGKISMTSKFSIA